MLVYSPLLTINPTHISPQSILTTTNLYNPGVLKQIESGAKKLLIRLKEQEDVPEDIQIVLGTGYSEGKPVIAYYLASMSMQTVFWAESVKPDLVTNNARAVVSQAHLGEHIYAMLQQDYIHCQP